MECKSLSLSEILNDWCAKYAALIAFSSLIVSIMGFIIPMVQFFFQPASQSWFTHNNELIFRGAILAAVISFLFYTYYVYPEKFAQRFEGKLSNQILCEINKAVAPGFYRRSTIDQAAILELQAIKILIITDSLKFEKLVPPINSQEKSIMQVMKDEIERISREYYDTKTSTNQVKFKHWYLIPESKLELNKKIIEEEILSGIGIDKNLRHIFLRDHVKGIEDRYFEILKPFPERTYIELRKENDCSCDVGKKEYKMTVFDFYQSRGERIVFEIEEGGATKVEQFEKAFMSFFTTDKNDANVGSTS